MPGLAQTPTMFVKAGGKNPLSLPECVDALASCGYSPDDFGNYKQVLARCGKARKDTDKADASPGGGPPAEGEREPLAHKRWLASCESGHISENTRHQSDRGDNSSSHCPLYEWQNAPCMPHSGRAGWRDTQHGAVTATDVATSNEVGEGNQLGAEGERAATKRAIESALDWGMNDQPASDEHRAKRFAAIANLNAKDGTTGKAANSSVADKDAIKEKYNQDKQTAVECVEGFFEFQWRKMANDTKNKREKASANADKSKARAEGALAKARKSGDPAKIEAAEARLRTATERQERANAEWARVKNLDPNDANACMGQSRGSSERGVSQTNAPTTDAPQAPTADEEEPP